MKAVVFTLGCKVNETESGSILAGLEAAGWDVSDALEPADVYVLNTCAVTAEAEKKSRQLVARARRFNPEAKVYVCGCASQNSPVSFEEKNVTYVCGTEGKEEKILARIAEDFGMACCSGLYPKQTRTRAFIKIQDGCNSFCSYCRIPYLRGRTWSRSIDDIRREIASCTSPEIVLNGINLTAYNYEGKTLTDLMLALKDVPARIRLGSLENGIISEDFLQACTQLKDFAPQFHLSLQSGSTAVLKAMNRHYTREQYLERCALVYRYFPEGSITTDIIAGFPTETEEDFAQSLSIIDEAGFARVHAFEYSQRAGTVSARMKDLPHAVKNARLQQLLSKGREAEKKFVSGFAGKTLDFIAEEKQGEYCTGYTGNYIKIYASGEFVPGQKYKVEIERAHEDGAIARRI
ncbi:MAG: MiaB/RimO family radical SAM methylthiotransferase [Clostridia bacterium]|nr:MiaB/RimO family radical SAM methylthiotransferase [Clostridia bacterium]